MSKYEVKKTSLNSSIAPSKDENRPKKNQSLRKKTGKKLGGQLGHKGKTLEMNSVPDHIIELRPSYCYKCGATLDGIISVEEKKRQVIDIPPIKSVCTEYQNYSKQCSCGCKNIADFPEGVNSPISYGDNIEALIGYYHTRQYLPFKRMEEMFHDVFNIKISQGALHCLLNRFSDKTLPVYQMIKEKLKKSLVVGTDETGVKVNGDNDWFWVWQNSKLTYIAHSNTRGKATIDTHFPEGFPNAVLVRDGWRAQINTSAKAHQTCLPHLLRHLNYLKEKYTNKWSIDFTKLLYDAIDLHKSGTINQKDPEVSKITQRLDALINSPPSKNDKELYTFYKRIIREKQHLFTFLFIANVPFDNNASERAIRNVKVKQKISGQFKNQKAAQNFAQIRSVIDTTIKNGMNILEAMKIIAKMQVKPIG